jgi:hypothetical protein
MLKHGEGVHVAVVPKGFELRIVAALSDRGVRISNRSSNNTKVGGLRVEASVNARHLRKEQRESIRSGVESALLRTWVRGIKRRNKRRVCRASCRRHFDRGRKRKSIIKNRQR